MAIYDDEWFEVWYSDGTYIAPSYVLIVATNLKDKQEILVIDPIEKNQVVFRSKSYEEVANWLWEDEFRLVEGRMFPDDGYGEDVVCTFRNSYPT